MKDPETESIKLHSRRFRAALENCPKHLMPITFENFPTGSCGDACLLLGKYLQNAGFGVFDYVLGEITGSAEDDWHSHAWLQKDGLIIDITADQFKDFDFPVIVTRGSAWHAKFRIKDIHPADYEIYDNFTRAALTVAYFRVIEFLEKTKRAETE